MSQTSKIAGALILAFVVFIISRGELPSYLGILGLGGHTVPDNCGASVGAAASSFMGNLFPSGGGGGVNVSVSPPPIDIGIGVGGGVGFGGPDFTGLGGFGGPLSISGGYGVATGLTGDLANIV